MKHSPTRRKHWEKGIKPTILSSYHRTLVRLHEEKYIQRKSRSLKNVEWELTDKGKVKAEELLHEIKSYVEEWSPFLPENVVLDAHWGVSHELATWDYDFEQDIKEMRAKRTS